MWMITTADRGREGPIEDWRILKGITILLVGGKHLVADALL